MANEIVANEDVTQFIENLDQPWQVEVCTRLREMVHQAVEGVEERIQYRKPHFLKNGQYAAVISPAKAAVSFMIFNVSELELPPGFEGPAERKWIKIRDGEAPDYRMLAQLFAQAASSL